MARSLTCKGHVPGLARHARSRDMVLCTAVQQPRHCQTDAQHPGPCSLHQRPLELSWFGNRKKVVVAPLRRVWGVTSNTEQGPTWNRTSLNRAQAACLLLKSHGTSKAQPGQHPKCHHGSPTHNKLLLPCPALPRYQAAQDCVAQGLYFEDTFWKLQSGRR